MTRIPAATLLMIIGAGALASADMLILRDGRRLQGDVVAMDRQDVEFEVREAFSRRTIRVPRREVARIEFDENDGRGGRDVFSGANPRGLRERQVSVTSREAWTDTGIDVRAGQQIHFQASGETRWGPGRRDGAEGERNSPYNAHRPLPDRPAAALIGRIGDDVFFIGADPGPFRIRSSGRLMLGINDDVLTDNGGSLRVTVSY